MANPEWVDRFLKRAEIHGAKARKGATSAAISRVEKKLGVTFPAALRAFYIAADGFIEAEASQIVLRAQESRYSFVSLATMLTEWKTWNDLLLAGDFQVADRRLKKARRAKVSLPLAPVWWHPGWVPLAIDGGGNSLMIDLSPEAERADATGLVLQHWHDTDERTVVARSLEALCESLSWEQERTIAQAAKTLEPSCTVKAWVFTLHELPGFCAKEHVITAKLDARLLDAPVMIVASSKEGRAGQAIDVLYESLPERGDLSAADVKRMFGLANKLETLLDDQAPDYFEAYLIPPGDVFTQTAFHDCASKTQVIDALRAAVVRVDETPHVVDWNEAFTRGELNELTWLTEAAAKKPAQKRARSPRTTP